MSWKLNIDRVRNGFVLSGINDNTGEPMTEVIKECEDMADTAEELAWYILNYFDLTGSKHDKRRVNVKIEGTE